MDYASKTIFLLLLLAGSVDASTLDIEGASSDGLFSIQRNPFYSADILGETTVCELSITITNPINGSYHARNTLTLNTTVSGGSGVCEFRIDNNDWNEYDCIGETITFPQGYFVTLNVTVSNDDCIASDNIVFLVYGRSGGLYISPFAVFFFMILTIFILFIFDDNKRELFKYNKLNR